MTQAVTHRPMSKQDREEVEGFERRYQWRKAHGVFHLFRKYFPGIPKSRYWRMFELSKVAPLKRWERDST